MSWASPQVQALTRTSGHGSPPHPGMTWLNGTGWVWPTQQAKQAYLNSVQAHPVAPAGTTPAAAPTTAAPTTDPSGQQSASAIATGILQSWGLPTSLLTELTGWITSGITDSSALSILLQQTPEYQARFPANKIREQNGLPPLSPAEYVSTEQSYRQAMQAAGLPSGFWDSQDDFTKLIASDVSPKEVQDRIDQASHLVNQTDPQARQALQSYYGVDTGHLIAHFLDPTVAAPILDKQASAAQIGGAALAQGLALTDKQKAEGYADQGISASQALNAYGQVAAVLPGEQGIAQRFGQTYSQGDAENEFLGGLASAQRKRQQLNQSETALFAGHSGLATTSYGGTTRAAEIGAPQSGSY